MADVKISELPTASTVSDSDIVVINQGGTTKTAVRSLIKNPGTVTSVTAGTGLSGGTITGSGTVALGIAGASQLGGIKVGSGLSIDGNGVLSASQAAASYAVNLPGSGNWLTAAPTIAIGTGDYTIEMFVSISAYDPSGADLAVFFDARGAGTNSTQGPLFYVSPEAGHLRLYSNNTVAAEGTGVLPIPTTGWHHIAAVRQSSAVTLYIDGVSVATGTDSTNWTSSQLYINAIEADTTLNATMKVASLRISDIARYSGSNYTVPSTAFSADVNSVYILLQDSTLDALFTPHGTPTMVGGPFTTSGVFSFSAGTTGLTPAAASGGSVVLGGTLAVASGGTGAATQQAALNALSGTQTAGYHFRSDGTNVSLQPMSVADVSAGTLQIANGGTGATTALGAMANLGNTIFPVSVRQPSNMSPASTTATTMTFAVGAGIAGTTAIDSYTLVQGDTVCFINQSVGNQSGPWVITTLGTASVAAVLTRPSWFTTGTAKSGTLCLVQNGGANTGFIITLSGPLNASGTPIAIGTATITVSQIWGRSTLATTGANTFASTQTLTAGTTTVVPAKFSTGSVVTTTPVAHAIEWDGTLMYLTTSGSARTTNVVNTSIPATSTSTGAVGQIAVDNTNNWLYVCTAANVWKRTALTTF